jgi:hypothetical protein
MVEEREGRRILFGTYSIDDFSVIYRGILYSGSKDQMVEEREGRRVLFGILR